VKSPLFSLDEDTGVAATEKSQCDSVRPRHSTEVLAKATNGFKPASAG